MARTHRTWSAGQYDRIATGFRHEAEAFVARLELGAGVNVLDAACGSGNLTIPAARTGACVTGFDLVGSLLESAAAWGVSEGHSIRFDEGSVERLPYAAAQFDVVMSMFGVMFAARPDLVVSELTRVTRPGGRVALANWTREGFVGEMLSRHVALVPPPAGTPSPLLWGDEAIVRERFDPEAWELSTERRMLTFRYPHTLAGTAELFRSAYGPTVRAMETLDEDGRARLAAALTDLWSTRGRYDGATTEVEAEYLAVIATRRPAGA